jgi:hypothetical protein
MLAGCPTRAPQLACAPEAGEAFHVRRFVDHERQPRARAREIPRRGEVEFPDGRIGDEQIVEPERREEPRLP